MENKRGQGMSTQTIILLILGLVVLAVLVIGFTSGWSTFRKQVYKTNVDSVVSDCDSACSVGSSFSYCSSLRDYRINEEDLNVKTSCVVLDNVQELGRGYFNGCGSIQCNLACSDIVIEDKNGNQAKGQIGASIPDGAYDVSSIANDVPEGQFCYIQ